MTKEQTWFICKGCGHKLNNDYCIRTPEYCYLCDPNVTVDELLNDGNDVINPPTQ